MKRYRAAAMLGFLIVAGMGAGWFLRPANPTTFRFGSDEITVLKVSLGTNHFFSTEPSWKQLLRQILPRNFQNPLGPAQIERRQTRYDALVVWLDTRGSNALSLWLKVPEAKFADGFLASGRMRQTKTGFCLEFPCFDRQGGRIPLRIRSGRHTLEFTVKNPRPAHPAKWEARPLPQTNETSDIAVILEKFSQDHQRTVEYEALLRSRHRRSNSTIGWMRWRITAFDKWGNYSEGVYAAWRPAVPPLPLPGPWRLQVERQEYLSAGSIPQLTNGEPVILSPSLRLQELGLRSLLLVDPGTYEISNGIVRTLSGNTQPANPLLPLAFSGTNLHPSLLLNIITPGIVCLSDLQPHRPLPRVRVREQERISNARIFEPRLPVPSATNINAGVPQVAQFFSIKIPVAFTNLTELEIISESTTDFFVQPPG